MSTVQIPSLPQAIGLAGPEQFEAVQGGTSVSVTAAQIVALGSGVVGLPQAAHSVYAGPTSGPAALPAFRALVAGDLPASTGTVQSVGLSMPAEWTVTNSPVTTTGTLTVTWNAPVTAPHGGTGQSVYAIGDLLYADTTTTLARLADIATGNALISGGVGVAPSWGKISLTTTVSGILPVANGGTGLASGTSGGILGYTASGTLASSVALTANAIVLGGGAGATPTVLGSLGTTTTVLHGNAAGAPTFGAVSLTADITGTLGAGNGGTGISSYAVGDVLFASGSTTLSKLADVATGNALISGGVTTAPSWGKIGLTTHVSGTLPIANGGTNGTTVLSAWDNIGVRGASISSASTLDLTSTISAPWFDLNGSVNVTAVTMTNGTTRYARCTGGCSFTPSATLFVNGATSGPTYTTVGNELLVFEGFTAGTVVIWSLNSCGVSNLAPANQATTGQGRNALVNGDFSVSQRGTTFGNPANGAYTIDRWLVFYDGSIGTFNIFQALFANGQPTNSRERSSGIIWQQTAAGSGSTLRGFAQRIPGVKTFAGMQVCLSFYANADSARTITASLLQNFGTGGSPSSQVNTACGSFNLTTSVQRFSATVALPTLSGLTTGSAGNDYLSVSLGLPLNTTMTITLWDIQLELGANASEFERRSFQDQLEMCLPFYEKSFAYATVPAQNVGAGTGEYRFSAPTAAATTERSPQILYHVMKRAAPTVTLYNPAATNAQARDITASADCSATATANATQQGFAVTATGNASTAVGNSLGLHYTAEAEL